MHGFFPFQNCWLSKPSGPTNAESLCKYPGICRLFPRCVPARHPDATRNQAAQGSSSGTNDDTMVPPSRCSRFTQSACAPVRWARYQLHGWKNVGLQVEILDLSTELGTGIMQAAEVSVWNLSLFGLIFGDRGRYVRCATTVVRRARYEGCSETHKEVVKREIGRQAD